MQEPTVQLDLLEEEDSSLQLPEAFSMLRQNVFEPKKNLLPLSLVSVTDENVGLYVRLVYVAFLLDVLVLVLVAVL